MEDGGHLVSGYLAGHLAGDFFMGIGQMFLGQIFLCYVQVVQNEITCVNKWSVIGHFIWSFQIQKHLLMIMLLSICDIKWGDLCQRVVLLISKVSCSHCHSMLNLITYSHSTLNMQNYKNILTIDLFVHPV